MGEVIEDPFRMARFLLELRRAGVTDEGTLGAMESVPREAFLAEECRHLALADSVLPIPCGQVMPRPVTVAGMVAALDLGTRRDKRVLVVGAGSGYTCAVVARLADWVYGVERYRGLVRHAKEALDRLKIGNVRLLHGDGLEGWATSGPFDRILLMGTVEAVPDTLYGQLSRDGFVLAPVDSDQGQFVRVLRDEDRRGRVLAASRFLPLLQGAAQML